VTANAELRLPLFEGVSLPGAGGPSRAVTLRLCAALFASTLRLARAAPAFDQQVAVTVALE
jgi:hypothetical protein